MRCSLPLGTSAVPQRSIPTSVLPSISGKAKTSAPRTPKERAPVSAAATPSVRAAAAQPSTQAPSDAGIDAMEAELANRIPVVILTGFLGSGKTTLLNHILKGDHGKRIAVIENEYGEQDIDSELVAMQDKGAEEIMMLNNGCLCCTVRGDLVKMLDTLHSRRDKFDQIVIETTGLANPAPIIQTFFMEDSIFKNFKLNGIVTLVDAKNIERHLANEGVREDGTKNEAVEQVAYADRIILNKTDLVTEEDLTRVEKRIRGFNRLARISRATRSQVDLDYVLGMRGFDLERVEDEVNPNLLKKKEPKAAAAAHSHSHDHDHEHEHKHGEDCHDAKCTNPEHNHSHDHKTEAKVEDCHDAKCTNPDHHHHHHEETKAEAKHGEAGHVCTSSCGHDHEHDHDQDHDHLHDDLVGSVSMVIEGDMDLEKVNRWLGLLLQYRGDDIYRMKGVLAINGFDKKFVFQGVHTLFEGGPLAPWKEGEVRKSRMVFIGRELDTELIKDGFATCMWRPPAEAEAARQAEIKAQQERVKQAEAETAGKK